MRDVTGQLERMTAMFPTMAHPVVMPPPGLSGELSGSAVPAAASTPLQPPIIAPQDPNEKTSTDERTSPTPAQDAGLARGGRARLALGSAEELDAGFSVGQSSLSLRRSGRFKRLLVGGAALLIVAAAVGTAVIYRDGQVTPTPRGKVDAHHPDHSGHQRHADAPAPAVKKVFWSLTSIPAGAGSPASPTAWSWAKTPRHIEEDAGDEEVPVRLSLPGYQDHVVHLKRSVSDAAEVKLTRWPRAGQQTHSAGRSALFFRRFLPTRNPHETGQ